jgi:hypothetical protein
MTDRIFVPKKDFLVSHSDHKFIEHVIIMVPEFLFLSRSGHSDNFPVRESHELYCLD